jgi:hypothetical protein
LRQGSLPVALARGILKSPSKTVLFAKLENLEKSVARQNDKIDRMSNRFYSGLQGPRTRSEWVKDLKDKNMLTQDNDFFKAFDVS